MLALAFCKRQKVKMMKHIHEFIMKSSLTRDYLLILFCNRQKQKISNSVTNKSNTILGGFNPVKIQFAELRSV